MTTPYAPYSKVIDTKVQRILKQRKFLADCIEAGVCPKCGCMLAQGKTKVALHYEHVMKCVSTDCTYFYNLGIVSLS